MQMSAKRACVLCFSMTLLVGMAWVLFGLLVIPVLPYAQLDRVLSAADLADAHKKEAAIAMLQQAQGNAWLFWAGAGSLLVLISLIGLISANRLDRELMTRP